MHDVVSLDDERRRRAARRGEVAEPACASDAVTGLPAIISEPELATPRDVSDHTGGEHTPSFSTAAVAEPVFAPFPSPATSANLATTAHAESHHRDKRTSSGVRGLRFPRGRAWLAPVKIFLRRLGAWRRPTKLDELAALVAESRSRALSNRLRSIATLQPWEQDDVQDVSGAVRRTHQAGYDIVTQGEVTPRPMFIASGWACRTKILPDGERRLVGLLLPGDGIGIRGCAEPLSVTTISALTTVETVDGAALLGMASQGGRYAGIAHAIGRASVQDEEFFINQIVRLGFDSPAARLAHLILELQWRLTQAGLATSTEFSMPVTYDTLSEVIGFSPSTVQKAMRMLQRKHMVRFRSGRIVLSRPALLREMSGFTAPDECGCRHAQVTTV